MNDAERADLAGQRLEQLRRARSGAALCRQRVLDAIDATPALLQTALGPLKDHTGSNAWTIEHDLSYYAWEAVKIINIAYKARGDHRVQAALDALNERAPELVAFRDAMTHPEDNRSADNIVFVGAAIRLTSEQRAGYSLQGADYVLDPRYSQHDALEALVEAAEVALLAAAGPDPPGLTGMTTAHRNLI